MKAGRELDALIAEKVMGRSFTGLWPFSRDLPAYSTDIRAAWEVVWKLQYRFTNFNVSAANGWGATFWDVLLDEETDEIRDCENLASGHGETAPHAICLAALAAVGWTNKGTDAS